MNYEFIIGTIIGLVGIAVSLWIGYDYIKKKIRPNLKNLLNDLASHKLSTKKEIKTLKKINLKLKMYGKNIPSAYINSFSSGKKAKTAILLEICIASNMEPTPNICNSFLGYDSPALRTDWKNAATPASNQPIIVDNQDKQSETQTTMSRPNVVYVSSLLKEKYPKAANDLMAILKKHDIPVNELSGTKDIWCRDYMPVQNRLGELIQFNYDPSYLKGNKEWEASRSDVHAVCEANGIKPVYSNIKIDGGNVVLYGDKAILTDKIFSENPEYGKEQLIAELENLLKAKVIIIPAYRSDYDDVTGHADGMVRFVDENTIMVNNLEKDYDYIRKGIEKACNENGLQYINVPFFSPKYDKSHPLNAIGIYANYLEVGNLIVLPKFNVEGNFDKESEEIFRQTFPDRIIETIDYNEVALEGGLLNCTTWTIFHQ